MQSIIDRFKNKYKKLSDDECWLWEGSMTGRKGHRYGNIYYRKKKNITAHRLSYILNCGIITDGLCVLHKCDVPACVNPNHLYLGTKLDNAQDAMKRGRLWNPSGENHPNSKLNNCQAKMIRKSDLPSRQLAKAYGVSKTTILFIKQNKTYINKDGGDYVG